MATISNQLITDVYFFDSTGNKFRTKKTESIPLPAIFQPTVSPDPSVFVYSKILYGPNYTLQAYVGETVAALNVIAKN